MTPKRILTIAGSDSGGGAGIQADLKTITVLGGFGMSAVTALTAQNTTGVLGICAVPPEFVALQIAAVAADIGIDAAKTGMLANAAIMSVVVEKIKQYGIERLVVDPVMVAKGGASLLDDRAKDLLSTELLPLAYIATPNIPEAEVFTGRKIESIEDMKDAARVIHGLGARNVVVKGGHLGDGTSDEAIDVLYDGKSFHRFVRERIKTQDTHGTGCTFSAALATYLGQGMDVPAAVQSAQDYIQEAIRYAWRIGAGHGPTNHLAPLGLELERFRCLEALKAALRRLADEPCGTLIPEGQSNLGYALAGAKTT
ncbi:MAG: bifunctional hydroxymethylpyrimidine kinase/phosphomethylpyrimidine kinase, partial [Smithellaceae bacterium]|nr:bifunctional hydroxymethylpyrimidine kinase/phosphomethylpyrimidine kinase [Smithellaceae bacterium]